MTARRRIRVALLQGAAAALAVAVSVASNQILNDGVWNWWWTLIAVPSAGAAAGLTLLMTRIPTTSFTEEAEDKGEAEDLEGLPEAPEPKKTERARHTSPQVVHNVRTDGSIIQIRDVGGDVEIGGS